MYTVAVTHRITILMLPPFQSCVCVCEEGAVFGYVSDRLMKQSRCERLPFVAEAVETSSRQTVVLHPDLISHTAKGHSEMM